jgi:hypothetical protein
MTPTKKKKIPNSLGYYFLHSNFILDITDNNDSTIIKVVTTITRHHFLKQTLEICRPMKSQPATLLAKDRWITS